MARMLAQPALLWLAVCSLALCARAQLPFDIPESLGPFLRFSSVDSGGTYTLTVLAAAQGSNVGDCLALDFPGDELGSDETSASLINTTSIVLDQYADYTFVRWKVVLQLGTNQTAVQYQITSDCSDVRLVDETSTAYTFVVPGRNQTWYWGYYSCNGFSDPSLAPPEGIDPMWSDVINQHTNVRPLNLLAGNGDQLYNDPFLSSNQTIQRYAVDATDISTVRQFNWTPALREWTNDWYFSHYAYHRMRDSDNYRLALASIPQTMIWDDHDVFNGYGSQPAAVRNTTLFEGIAQTARRFYLLFQQHSTDDNLMEDLVTTNRTSCLHTTSLMGPNTAYIAIDVRSERTPFRVMNDEGYELIAVRINQLPRSVEHLILLNPQPLTLPATEISEALRNVLSITGINSFAELQSAWVDSDFKSIIQQAFQTVGFNPSYRFGVPDLTDVIDGWYFANHQQERQRLVNIFQTWAASRDARVTCLSGDAHIPLAAELFTNPNGQSIHPMNDVRYMASLTSSAIGNNPQTTLATAVEAATAAYEEFIDDNRTTQVRQVPAFANTPHINYTYTAGTRNWLLIEQSQPSYLNFTWRLEYYPNATNAASGTLQPVTATFQVPPYVPLSQADRQT